MHPPQNAALEKNIGEVSVASLLRGDCQIASEPTSFVRPLLPVGAATKKGSKNEACVALRESAAGATCRNQDNFLVGRINVQSGDVSEEFRIYAVLDGHGLGKFSPQKRDGDFFSDAAARLLVRNIADALNKGRLRESFLHGKDQDVRHFFEFLYAGIDATLKLPRGGSTLTLVIHDVSRFQVFTSYVGDSLGIYLSKNKGLKGGYVPIKLTPEPHRPTHPREKRRLTEMGFGAYINPYGRLGPPAGVPAGYGLAVSRSLGDASVAHCGKSAVPDVGKWRVGDGTDFILLATDGLWDVLTEEEACEWLSVRLENSTVASSALLTSVARELAESVAERYQRRFGVSDDVTVLLVDLREVEHHKTTI